MLGDTCPTDPNYFREINQPHIHESDVTACVPKGSSSISVSEPVWSLWTVLPCMPFICSSSRVYEILQNNVGVSSSRNSVSGFRTFCTGQDLSTKKCVPCNLKGMRPMTEESASNLLPKVDGWNLMSESGLLKLKKSWRVKSFTKGLEMFKLVADVAEAEGHHPDLHLVGWNNVTIEIWTHAVGGLTENDFILAAKINSIDMQNLMRRKTTDS